MWRRLLILFAVLGGALGGIALALKSERVANDLRQRLQNVAATRLGVRLDIGHLEVGLWPPRLLFEDVRVTAPGADAPFITLRRGAAAVYPWPSVTGALVVDVLELDGLTARGDVSGLERFATSPRGELRAPVDLRSLRLWNTELHLRGASWQLDAERTDLQMEPAHGRRELALDVGSAVVTRGGDPVRVEGRVRATLRGSLDRPLGVTVGAAELFVGDARLALSGGATLQGSPSVDLELATTLPLARLRDLVAGLPPLEGLARATVRLKGPLADPALSARVHVAQLTLWGTPIGELEAQGRLDAGRIKVDELKLSQARAGKVTGSAVLDLAAGPRVSGAVRLHEVSLPVVLELAGLPDSWVDGHATGDVEVKGRLSPLELRVQGTLALEGFRVLDRSFRAADAVTVLEPGPVVAQTRITIGASAVTIDEAELTRGSSRLLAQGALHYDVERGLELHAESDDLAFADVGTVAGVPFGGRGAVAAAIEGPYADPTISATVSASDFSVLGYLAGDVRATVIYSGLVLRVDRASGRRGGGTFTGSGAIDFRDRAMLTEANAELSGVGLDSLLTSLRVPAEVRRHLVARVDGPIVVAGPLLAPEVTCRLRAPSLSIDAADLGRLTLDADYSGKAGLARVHVDAGSKTGALQSDGVIDKDGSIAVDGQVRGVSLAAIASLMGGIDIAGTATGTLHLEGPAAALKGRLEATSPDLVSYGTRFGATKVSGVVDHGTMTVTGTSNDGRSQLQSQVELTRTMPYNLTAKFRDLKISSLWPALQGFEVSGDGSLFSQGLLTDASSMQADVVVDAGRATLFGVSLVSARPVRLQYAENSLHVIDLVMVGPGVSGTMGGVMGVDGSLGVTLTATADLEAARPSFWRLTGTRGRVDTRLTIGGTWAAPTLVGESTLREGTFRVADGAQSFESASGRLVFSGRSISVERLSARLGGGDVALVGQIALPPGKEPELDLHAELAEVALRPSPQLSLTLRGDLRLAGERKDLQLSGELDVHSLRYTANVDLERLIPKPRSVPPLRVPALEPGSAVRLAVRVTAADNIIVTSPVLETELHADLVVTGTTERLGMIGSVTPLWARARYQDKTFTVEHASILLTDEYRIFTEYDLRARTQACNMQITVAIQGTSDDYNVVPSGTDDAGPVSAPDVLACLQLGLRLRDLRGTEGNSLLQDRLTATSLDALWAVSGLDQQVKRILPIVDELRVSSGWSQRSKRTSTRIVVGKELGRDVQLTYSRGLDVEYDQIVSVAYKMNELATMLGTWNTGTDAQVGDFGLDLRLRWEFQ